MTSQSIESIALLALAYQELAKGSATGPIGDPSFVLDEYEAGGGEISLLALIASSSLHEVDWLIVRLLSESDGLADSFEELLPVDPRRAEAIAHAWPPGEPPPLKLELLPLLERWQEVEYAMERFRNLGLTATRTDVELTAVSAYRAATGASLDEALDRYAVEIE